MRPETVELFNRLKESDWTAHIGEPSPNTDSVDRATALEMAASEQWESMTLDERNLLALAISQHSYDRYKQWGEVITDERRQEIDALVDAKLPPDGPLGDVRPEAKNACWWLVAHAIIESEFADAHERRFFREAVEWLIQGHIIVSRTDWWPKGRAVIY